MEGLTLTTATTSSAIQLFPLPILHASKSTILTFPCRKPRDLSVFASTDDANIDECDKMELKFADDSRITLAKALNEVIEEVPFDVSYEKKLSKSIHGLNMVQPMPKNGIEFAATGNEPVGKTGADVILQKAKSFYASDRGNEHSNLSMEMGKESQKGRFSDITLLTEPGVMSIDPESREDSSQFNSIECKDVLVKENGDDRPASAVRNNTATLLQKPKLLNLNNEEEQERSDELVGSSSSSKITENNLDSYLSDNQLVTASGSNLNRLSGTEQTDSGQDKGSAQADMREALGFDGPSRSTSLPITDERVLVEKPKKFDLSSRAIDKKVREEVVPSTPESLENALELENFLSTSSIKAREDIDWTMAEKLANAGEREVVELISSTTKGFVASFGSLLGFLPYRNLTTRWKFLAFESWLRRKGLDPSNYRQNLGVIGTNEATSSINIYDSLVEVETRSKVDGTVTSDMKLEDLLVIYDQEKLKFLSAFVGQRIKVVVVLADRKSRKLIFSIKPKEKEVMVEKKRNLMVQLRVGDSVKCRIKKITYSGIFVEIEGLPALIHQTEIPWDATLESESFFKVGQMIEAKVHQLDFSLERIFLSLKEVTPDPLLGALEAVVGNHGSLFGRFEPAEPHNEWPDVETLIKKLQQVDGIQSVSKGQYFLSPGLASTFQVYMASILENRYKLLARTGNRVQEVIVETSLSKEQLKSAILE